ncbi:unnamed protein product [Clonostachys rhizophaga]|uniref:Uncharacterized protein n=1 Tax=Clonostachys rhizophaga TaxID=160324 RepID=A0A9N9YQT8_9HYPO|nr:unnamed protein product [Clonostachys rhizophaga]
MDQHHFKPVRKESNVEVWTKYLDGGDPRSLCHSLQSEYQNNFRISLSRNIYIVYIYINTAGIQDKKKDIADDERTHTSRICKARGEGIGLKQRLDDIVAAEKLLRKEEADA